MFRAKSRILWSAICGQHVPTADSLSITNTLLYGLFGIPLFPFVVFKILRNFPMEVLEELVETPLNVFGKLTLFRKSGTPASIFPILRDTTVFGRLEFACFDYRSF